MAILLTLFVVVGLPAGWFDSFWTESLQFHVMVWGCILIATVAGVATEVGVARAALPVNSGGSAVLRRIGAVWGAATAVSALLFVLLLTPLFDPLNVVALVGGLIAIELAAVSVVAAVIEARAAGRALRLETVGRFAVINISSMAAGVVAGRLFLAVFYPGVG